MLQNFLQHVFTEHLWVTLSTAFWFTEAAAEVVL